MLFAAPFLYHLAMKPKRMATPDELQELKNFIWNPPEPDCDLGADNTYDDDEEDEDEYEVIENE